MVTVVEREQGSNTGQPNSIQTYPEDNTLSHSIAYNRPGNKSNNKGQLPTHQYNEQQALAKSKDQLLREDEILRLWLAGDTMQQIMAQTGFSWATVSTYIKKGRENLKLVLDDSLENLAVERIEAFRDIKRRAVTLVDIKPNLAPQLLRVAMDAEVYIGKIQGVVSDKVVHIGKIQHEHKKLYDFNDVFPDAPGDNAQVIEAVAVEARYREIVEAPINSDPDNQQSPVAPYYPTAHATTPAQSDLRRGQRTKQAKGTAVPTSPDDFEFIIG